MDGYLLFISEQVRCVRTDNKHSIMCKLVHLLFWHWLTTTALATSAELSITGSPQLNKWEENGHKRVYHYNFTKEEYIKLKCAFKRTATMPEDFTLSFYIDGVRQVREIKDYMESKFNADVTHYFRIEKRNKVVTCVAEPVSGRPVDGVNYYISEVKLHYRPSSPEQTRSTQRPGIPAPIKDPCVPNPCGSNSICNNNHGTAICSCRQGFRGNPLTRCLVVDSTTPRQANLETTTVSSAERSNQNTTTSATSANLSITGLPQLNTWEENGHKKVYHYNFTEEKDIKLKCVFERTAAAMTEYYTISLFIDGVKHTNAYMGSKLYEELTDLIRIRKRNKVITCVAEPASGPWRAIEGANYYTSEVQLHYRPGGGAGAPEQTRDISTKGPVSAGFDLNITGPPKLILWKQKEGFTEKIYNYSYTDDEQTEFNCTSVNLDPDRLIRTEFTLDTEFEAGCYDEQCTGTLSHEFKLHRGNHVIMCKVSGWVNDTLIIIMRSMVLLHNIDVNTSETTAGSREVGPVDTDQLVSVDTGSSVSVTLLAATAVIVAIIIIASLIAVVLKYRAIVRKLDSNRIPEHIRNRPPLSLPPEIVYDHVYSHGAGLLRPPLKPLQ